jgi:hypothetical protein
MADGNAKIRVLELHPPPWYLRWLPRILLLFVPLRASLMWTSLNRNTARRPSLPDCNSPNTNGGSPPYKALSYTWGTKQATRDIYINGQKLQITFSLALALLHLRPDAKSLRLWIDQICINQEDKAEKTKQVLLMDRIYRNTEEALVWLGPAADGSNAVFDVFNKLGAFAEQFDLLGYYTKKRHHELQDIELRVDPDDPKTIQYHTFCDSVIPDFTHAFFACLMAFYRRPWFTRAWVIQEFALPPKVTFVCGHKTIRAEILMVVLQMISLTMITKIIRRWPEDRAMTVLLNNFNEMNTLQPFFESRQRRKAWDEGRTNGDNLYYTLHRVRVEQSVQATRGCDIVYGLLGLVNDAEQLDIEPDYSEDDDNIQAALTYTHTAKAIITSGKVDLLVSAQHMKRDLTLPSWVPDWRSRLRQSYAWNGGKETVDFTALAISRHMDRNGTLPSWVPDWRCDIRRSFAWLRDVEAAPLFRASDGQALKLAPNDDPHVLALQGYKVDEIEEVGGPWAGGSHLGGVEGSRFPHEEYITYLSQVRQMCLLSAARGTNIYTSAERRDEAIWRIPVGDIDQDDTASPFRAKQACKLRYDHCVAELELQMQADGLTGLDEYNTRLAEVDAMGKKNPGPFNTWGDAGSIYRIRMKELKGKRPFLSQKGYFCS